MQTARRPSHQQHATVVWNLPVVCTKLLSRRTWVVRGDATANTARHDTQILTSEQTAKLWGCTSHEAVDATTAQQRQVPYSSDCRARSSCRACRRLKAA